MSEELSTRIKVKTYEVSSSTGKWGHCVTPFKAKFRDCEKWRSSQSTSLLSFLVTSSTSGYLNYYGSLWSLTTEIEFDPPFALKDQITFPEREYILDNT